jgi:hypothetical protein
MNLISGEQFYLWLLLTVLLSPKSYIDLRTVNGTVYNTFHRACVLFGLLEVDQEWIACCDEADIFTFGSSLQHLFAIALTNQRITHPMVVWDQSCDQFCDDITLRRLEQLNHPATLENPQYDYELYLIGQQLRSINKQLADFYLLRVILYLVNDKKFLWMTLIRNCNRDDEGQQYEGMAETMNNN